MEEEQLELLSIELQEALDAISALVDFHRFAYADYHTVPDVDRLDPADSLSYSETTLGQMQLALEDYFEHMQVFRKYKALINGAAKEKEKSKKAVDSRRERYKATRNTKSLKEKQPALRQLRLKEEDAFEQELEKTTMGCPKLHLMNHFCQHIMDDGALLALSSSCNKLCLKTYKEGFGRSNKDLYVGQIFNFVSHRNALIRKTADLRYLLEHGDLSPEVRADIEMYIGCYQSKNARTSARRNIRRRLAPKVRSETAERKRQLRIARAADKKRTMEALNSHYKALTGRSPPGYDPDSKSDSDSDTSTAYEEEEDSETLSKRQRRKRKRYQRLREKYLARGIDTDYYAIKKDDLGTLEVDSTLLEPQTICKVFVEAQHTGNVLRTVGEAAETLDKKRGILPEEFKESLRERLAQENLLDRFDVGDLDTLPIIPYLSLNMPRTIPRFPLPPDIEDYVLRCTPPNISHYRKHKRRRNDFLAYEDGTQTYLANQKIGRAELFFNVRFEQPSTGNSVERSYVLVRPTEWMDRTEAQAIRRIFKVKWSTRSAEVIPLDWVTSAVSVVPILLNIYRWNESFSAPLTDQEKELSFRKARGFVVNNRVDEELSKVFY